MPIAESYTLKPDAISDYFDAIHAAQAPERFSQRFLEQLGFSSTNDRMFIGVLKDLRFLDPDGKPTDTYFKFLDRSNSGKILATQIRAAYHDLFAINKNANDLSKDEIKNKMKVIFKGAKSDNLLNRMAATFQALSALADFSAPVSSESPSIDVENTSDDSTESSPSKVETAPQHSKAAPSHSGVKISGLQYHINIVLPESRDQMVYDSIFKSLREHLG